MECGLPTCTFDLFELWKVPFYFSQIHISITIATSRDHFVCLSAFPVGTLCGSHTSLLRLSHVTYMLLKQSNVYFQVEVIPGQKLTFLDAIWFPGTMYCLNVKRLTLFSLVTVTFVFDWLHMTIGWHWEDKARTHTEDTFAREGSASYLSSTPCDFRNGQLILKANPIRTLRRQTRIEHKRLTWRH